MRWDEEVATKNSEDIVQRGTVDGTFTGFGGDTLVKFSDGTFWLQDEYKCWYHYAYRPEAEII